MNTTDARNAIILTLAPTGEFASRPRTVLVRVARGYNLTAAEATALLEQMFHEGLLRREHGAYVSLTSNGRVLRAQLETARVGQR